jgi:hypothetical protein
LKKKVGLSKQIVKVGEEENVPALNEKDKVIDKFLRIKARNPNFL